MRSRLVRIGNSRGLRLPKTLLAESGLSDEVEITLERGALVIRAARVPRAGWAESVERLGPEEPVWPHAPNRFDEEEWRWE
jgi:antitoxin MazE